MEDSDRVGGDAAVQKECFDLDVDLLTNICAYLGAGPSFRATHRMLTVNRTLKDVRESKSCPGSLEACDSAMTICCISLKTLSILHRSEAVWVYSVACAGGHDTDSIVRISALSQCESRACLHSQELVREY